MRLLSLLVGIFAIIIANISWVCGASDSDGQKQVSEICGGGCVEIEKGPTLLETRFIFTSKKPWFIPMGSFYGYQVTADAVFKLQNSDKDVIKTAQFKISLPYINLEDLLKLVPKISLASPLATGSIHGLYQDEQRILKIMLKGLQGAQPPKFQGDCLYSVNDPITNLSLVVNDDKKVNCSNIHPFSTTIIDADESQGYFIIHFCTTDGHRYWLAVSNKFPLDPTVKEKIKNKILSLTFPYPNNGTKIYCEKDFVEQNYLTK